MKCNATVAVVDKIMTYETCGIPKILIRIRHCDVLWDWLWIWDWKFTAIRIYCICEPSPEKKREKNICRESQSQEIYHQCCSLSSHSGSPLKIWWLNFHLMWSNRTMPQICPPEDYLKKNFMIFDYSVWSWREHNIATCCLWEITVTILLDWWFFLCLCLMQVLLD